MKVIIKTYIETELIHYGAYPEVDFNTHALLDQLTVLLTSGNMNISKELHL